MYELPTEIELNGTKFAIRNKGDFRLILDCFSTLEDTELSPQERIISCLIIFYEDINDLDDLCKFEDVNEAVEQMYNFFNCNEPKGIGMRMNYKLLDWEQDSQLICSAVNNVANKEIRNEAYIHWWTFMGYFMSIGDCTLSTIIEIRHKIAQGKKLEDYESRFKRENPQYFSWNMQTIEQMEANEFVKNLWNKS